MADRSVSVKLSADVGQFTQAMGQAAGAAKGLGDSLPESKGGFLGNVNKHAGELNQLAGSMATVGAVSLAAFGGAAKAAIDWESAFAGVKKTVDDSAAGYAALSDELRQMARELPASHAEIAAVAEAAGQLGVAREDISTFSRTMIDLGETTNLSADEAATALARFTAITGSSHDEIGRLGATLVGLGNNFAATESEILQLSLRLAGMGNLVGMSEADIMGLSTAMMAVGINAEAGGTAMSISMSKINDAVLSGSDKLELFAGVADMTAEQFASAWRNDPSAALTQFIEGLGRVAAEGGNTNQVLRDLGITNQRERDAMLRLAGASGIVADAFALANEEYRKGTALSEEAALRYETAASKIQVAWNNIKDAAISAGAAIAPVIADAADSVAGFATFIGGLPAPVLTATTAVAGVGGAALLGMAGLIKLTTTIASTRAALVTLAGAAPRTAAALTALGAAAGPLALVATAVAAIAAANNSMARYGTEGIDATTEAINRLVDAQERAGVDGLFDRSTPVGDWEKRAVAAQPSWMDTPGTRRDLDTLAGALDRLFNPTRFERFNDALFGPTGMGQADKLWGRLSEIDAALAHMATSGGLSQAREGFSALYGRMVMAGAGSEDINRAFSQYAEALMQVRDGYDIAADGARGYLELSREIAVAQGKLDEWTFFRDPIMDGLAGVIDAAASSVDGMADSMDDYASSAMAAAGANQEFADSLSALVSTEIAHEDAIAKATATIKENGAATDTTTEAGRRNVEALQKQLETGRARIETLHEQGASESEVQAAIDRATDSYVENARAAGVSTEEAKRNAEAYYGLSSSAKQAKGVVDGLSGALRAVPKSTRVSIAMQGWGAAKSAAESVASAVLGVPTSRQIAFSVAGAVTARDAALNVASAVLSIPTSRTTTVRTTHVSSGIAALGRADGGSITGWSPHSRADNIPVMATAGEFMHSVAAVQHYGESFMHAVNNRSIPREWVRAIGLADGGSVRPAGSSRPVPAHRIPSTAAAPQVHVAAPSLDGAVLEIPVGPFVAALDRRDRAATVSARVHMKGA